MAVSTQASVELENMPFCGMLTARGHTAGATRTSVYFGILLYTPRHASPSPQMCFLLSSTLAANAVLCCAVPGRAWSALGCAPAHSTQTRRQKPAYMDNLFFRSKFLCPNDYWADFFQPSKPLFALGPLGMHRILALFVFSPSLVGVKSFKDIEPHVVCLISRLRVCLTVSLIFYSCVLLLPQDRSNGH